MGGYVVTRVSQKQYSHRNSPVYAGLVLHTILNTKLLEMKKMHLSLLLLTLVLAASCKKKKDPEPDITGKFHIVAADSKLEWEGYKPGGGHNGSFDVAPVDVTVEKGKITGGTFTIDIRTIKDFDLTDVAIREQLLEHLQSPDFFDVVLHPTASFVITAVEGYTGGTTGAIEGANTLIKGTFTMLGKPLPISFPAKVSVTATTLRVEANFKIDRLKWGMNSFSDPNGELYIFPDIDITLDIKANK
jgi:polyisoprenoid-binding protein YceI